MWKRAFLTGVVLCTISSTALAQSTLRVDITQGVGSPLILTVPDAPSGVIAGVADGSDAGTALSSIVRNDLASVGLYRLISSKVDLSAGGAFSLLPFQKLGAQALVVGRASAGGNGLLSFECSLFDVFGTRRELYRRILVTPQQWRRAAHKCADLVFEHTTGDQGHFDTRIVMVAETGPKIVRTTALSAIDYDGANPQQLTQGSQLVAMPRYSPDGRSIAFMAYLGGMPRILVADLTSGQSIPLELPAGVPFAPRFSPDSRKLVLAIAREEDSDIYEIDLASRAIVQLTDDPGMDISPSYSPDGQRIVFESTRSGQQQLYVMNADGGKATRISFGAGRYGSPVWSPRGDFIAFTRVNGNSMQIGVMRSDGTRERILTNGSLDESPSWDLAGRTILFQHGLGGDLPPEIWTVDLTGKVKHRVMAEIGGSDPYWSGARP
jgi:TolB protein